MHLTSTLTLSMLVAVASAHFQLQYPVPRGPFVEDNEPKFCDGYNSAADNRTMFPLSGGFINLNSEHPKWTAGVLVSTVQNPKSFDDFSKSLPVPFFQASGEGVACIKLDLSNTGISGVADGANVTIQIEYNGGDGNLFQCADLMLSGGATVPGGVTCQNQVSTSTPATSATIGTASASATKSSGADMAIAKVSGWTLVAGTVGVLLAW